MLDDRAYHRAPEWFRREMVKLEAPARLAHTECIRVTDRELVAQGFDINGEDLRKPPNRQGEMVEAVRQLYLALTGRPEPPRIDGFTRAVAPRLGPEKAPVAKTQPVSDDDLPF